MSCGSGTSQLLHEDRHRANILPLSPTLRLAQKKIAAEFSPAAIWLFSVSFLRPSLAFPALAHLPTRSARVLAAIEIPRVRRGFAVRERRQCRLDRNLVPAKRIGR